MSELFRVVHAETGEPVTAEELEAITLQEPWAKGLIYCDMDGFAVQSDGSLILLDECGRHVYPSPELFRVEWLR